MKQCRAHVWDLAFVRVGAKVTHQDYDGVDLLAGVTCLKCGRHLEAQKINMNMNGSP